MKHTPRKASLHTKTHPAHMYTNIAVIGSEVLGRWRDIDGCPIYTRTKYTPSYYVPAADPTNATHRAYDGTPLDEVECTGYRNAKQFLQDAEDSRTPVYGNIQMEYITLARTYEGAEVPYDSDNLYVVNLDIEVDRDPVRGFSKVEDPFNPVTAIGLVWRHRGQTGTVLYGTGDYTPTSDETYVQCTDEQELLMAFLSDFSDARDYPDVVTGWNVAFYDIPYLVNRMKLLFSEEVVMKLSPFERIASRRLTLNGRDQVVMDIKGLAVLDYYELYRKFTYTQQESYRLDHIAHIELGKRKLSYAEFRSLYRLYREDHQKFIEYNRQDIVLVDELDEKMKLIDMVCAMAYSAKANFADTFKQVRLWDVMIYHKLLSEGKQIPPRKDETKTEQFAGAFVKDPLLGLHNWVVTFDVASMYPHIIREWNLSPETIASRETVGRWSVDDFLTKKVDTGLWVGETVGNDCALAGNGLQTRRDVEGFLPNMLKTLYDERIRYKGMMKKSKAKLELVKEQLRAGETPELLAQQRTLKKEISAYNNQQTVRKVQLNSLFGGQGTPYFRYYDLHLAEAITKTGQIVIQWIANDINAYLNETFKTKEDYIIGSDTDSVFCRMSAVVKMYQAAKPDATKDQIVTALDKFCKAKMEPLIAKSLSRLAEYLNVAIPCLNMVRDAIADKGIFLAKKRYIMNTFDVEGVRYSAPVMKVMGIEAVKSSTPTLCREAIMDVMKLFMNGTQEDVWRYVKTAREKFAAAKFEDVAFPRSVNGLEKYAESEKGVPIHVKGALAFNEMLEKTGLSKEYETIHEGEKIRFCYLLPGNPLRSHVLSCVDGCPPEWRVEKFIDYEKQWEKSLIEPLESILGAAGWSAVRRASLFD